MDQDVMSHFWECDDGGNDGLGLIALQDWKSELLPPAEKLSKAQASLLQTLPSTGMGFAETKKHITEDIVPGLNGSSISPNYYGFVTGGVTPAALWADHVVSAYDQNVQVNLPGHSVATDVEAQALRLLLDLFDLDQNEWGHMIMTTGATASNILGLACGREFVLRTAADKNASELLSVGEHGVINVMNAAGVNCLQVLSTMPHSSLGKAAGILGIGRASVKNICLDNDPLKFNFALLEHELSKDGVASIVAVSCGEVNTGRFATDGLQQFKEVRRLCDRYGAWLHVDGAFGIFGRVLNDGSEFSRIKQGCQGLELADSITGDAHKLLNVPYDCGFFFSRHIGTAQDVCQNANAAYLSANASGNPPPNNIGIENSRRFRALPGYASLVAYGRDGYRHMLERQIRLAREIAGWLFDHPAYVVLPHATSKQELLENTFMIVLFRATDGALNVQLGKRINASSRIFVSGTQWDGEAACRIAISNWRADVERDFQIVTDVLGIVAKEGQ